MSRFLYSAGKEMVYKKKKNMESPAFYKHTQLSNTNHCVSESHFIFWLVTSPTWTA